MEKMKMETPNLTDQNIEKIAEMFPNCVTEGKDENGQLKKLINFDMLKQMLSDSVTEGKEVYEFTWPGKKEAIVEANTPIRKTLRPCKDESKNWDMTENLYIEGDNLEVLKLLQESYLGKVKMIYIDPPYNTGNDFIYEDNFLISKDEYDTKTGIINEDGSKMFKNTDTRGSFHSDWCSMIYPRLLLARNLLSDDGMIFISINDIEIENLKKICNEIFGSCNFIADLIWSNKEGGGSSDSRLFRLKHEHILCYGKKIEFATIEGESISNSERYKSSDEYENVRGKYYLQKLGMGSIQYSKSLDYPIEAPDGSIIHPSDNNNGKKACWRWSKEKFQKNQKQGMVEIKKDTKGIWTVYTKQYLNFDNDGNFIKRTQRPMGIIDRFSSVQATKYLESIGLGRAFPYSKPIDLIIYLLERIEPEDDVILDFFSGSATTADAVLELNARDGYHRKFIMVQIPEKVDKGNEDLSFKNICEIGKERIRRAGEKIKAEHPEAKDLDIGFRVLKVASSNMNDVYYAPDDYSQGLLDHFESNIKEDRSSLDLLFGCLLDWGLPLSLPYTSEEIDGFTVHNYNDGDLIACFDENISDSVIKEIAKRQPLRAVFRDSSFESNPSKINVSEIFKMISPDTTVKVI